MEIQAYQYDKSPLLFIDMTTETASTYDSPCILLLIGSTVISSVFRYSYANDDTEATINAATRTGSTALKISSFDIVVNSYIVTRRRYSNPGVSKSTAFNDAKKLLLEIYNKLKQELNSTNEMKITTLNHFPATGSSATVENLK